MIFLQPYKKFFVFSGRASRKEFFLFHLLIIIVFIVLSWIDKIVGGGLGNFFIFWYIFNIIPQLALVIRRLHDTNTSGWMSLLAILPLVNLLLLVFCFFKKSDQEANRFGLNPQMIIE